MGLLETPRTFKGINFVSYDDTDFDQKFWRPVTQEDVAWDSKVENNFQPKRCCLVNAETINSFVLTKKSTIYKIVDNLMNQEETFFTILSRELKKVSSLYVLNDKTYGQIINAKQIPTKTKTPELHRMLENHQLWEKRYISIAERNTVSYDSKNATYNPDALDSEKCPDIYSKDIFTDRFIEEYSKEVSDEDEKNPGFNNAEWMSIYNFYLHPDLCQKFNGMVYQMRTGTAFLHQLKPNDLGKGLNFRPMFSATSLNVIIPLKSGFDSNGEILFFKQNCTMNNFKPGKMYVFPGELTHSFEVLPIQWGKFTFVEIKMGTQSLSCYETYGTFLCPGFEIDINDPPTFIQNHSFRLSNKEDT